jgi:hypothetical protein
MRRKGELAVVFGVLSFARQHYGIAGGCWLSQPGGGEIRGIVRDSAPPMGTQEAPDLRLHRRGRNPTAPVMVCIMPGTVRDADAAWAAVGPAATRGTAGRSLAPYQVAWWCGMPRPPTGLLAVPSSGRNHRVCLAMWKPRRYWESRLFIRQNSPSSRCPECARFLTCTEWFIAFIAPAAHHRASPKCHTNRMRVRSENTSDFHRCKDSRKGQTFSMARSKHSAGCHRNDGKMPPP